MKYHNINGVDLLWQSWHKSFNGLISLLSRWKKCWLWCHFCIYRWCSLLIVMICLSLGMVDVIFADVAQPDQTRIVALNAHNFLKNGGHFVISIKVHWASWIISPPAKKKSIYSMEIPHVALNLKSWSWGRRWWGVKIHFGTNSLLS